MFMNPLVWIIAVLALTFIVAPMLLGPAVGLFTAVIFSVTLLAALQWLFKVPLFPLDKKRSMWVTVIGIGVLFVTGAFAAWGFAPPAGLSFQLDGTPAAQVVTGEGIEGIPVTLDTACTGANPSRIGVSSTVTVFCRDRTNNNPNTKTGLCAPRVYVNGVERSATSVAASGFTFTGPVGASFRIVGGNASSYIIESTGCITEEVITHDLDVYQAIAETNGAITCYDTTAATALSGGTNSSQEDYDITLAANQDEVFYCKFKSNVADKAYNLFAVATAAFNDIDDLTLDAYHSATCQAGHTSCARASTVTFSEAIVPKYLRSLSIAQESTYWGETNISDGTFDHAYELSSPILLEEFDEVKYQFTIEAGSTDPATSNTWTSSDMGFVCFFDAQWDQGSDGVERMSHYTHDSSQTEKGVASTTSLRDPVGKTLCTVIEGL